MDKTDKTTPTPKPTHTPMRPSPTPKTLAELLPGIQALLSEEAVAMLSSQKESTHTPRQTSSTHQTRTPFKHLKPMNVAEILALQSPTLEIPQQTTARLEPAVKFDKTKSPISTQDGQNKHSTAKKSLNFQPKQNAAPNIKATMIPVVSKKPKDKSKASSDEVSSVSGVYGIPEKTPVIRTPKQMGSKPKQDRTEQAKHVSLNLSDASFIQREKEIYDLENKCDALTEESTKKITVINSNNKNQDLSELESQAENNLKTIDNAIEMFYSMKEKQLESLQRIRKLICERCQTTTATTSNATIGNNNTVKSIEIEPKNVDEKFGAENSPSASGPTVIKSKPPSYKIPRKGLCLRKKKVQIEIVVKTGQVPEQ